MKWNDRQRANIELFHGSVEEYERKMALEEAEKYLADTDYVLIKLFEYTLTGKISTNDYKDVFKKREEARNKINELRKNKP